MQARPMAISRLVMALFVAVAVLMAPLAISPAHAGPLDEARTHYQRGNQLFQSGDYNGAIREFAAADRLAPSPLLGFNIALCHDRLGQTDEALRRYREYLKAVPNASNRAAVEDSIRRLSSATKPAKPAPEPAKPDPPAVEADSPASPQGEAPAERADDAAPRYGGNDAGLKRVSAIDVSATRARYRGDSSPEPGPDASSDEPGTAGPLVSEGGQMPPPPPATRQPAEKPAPIATPIYKKWWFWVILGVGALVVINLAVDDSSSSDQPRVNGLVPQDPAGMAYPAGGATLMRF